ncbi:hypothetical protein [Alloyangia pacifica]|uniref:Uncharacterized protein n=1 Tax=Alloyangia pacifica TaxID=311180 RepID=A0A1I6WMF7_9RHOB|nr:hypothetical protein [Alloyangia pacifica]SDI93587.1 hypothetical protein SAMN04488245_13216 [Alloyangia pacifica]SFT27169.1 hypothetical protein SAMN04488050_12816 [Alloyangia pacifica]
MKRFLAMTALTSVLATGALAATEEQATLINNFAPDVDVSMLTEDQVIQAMAIANSGESDTDKRDRIETIAMRDSAPTTFSQEQMAQIEVYLPADKVMMLTGEQRGDALAIIAGGSSDDDIRAQVAALGEDIAPALTAGEISRVEELAPDADLTVLTAAQVSEIRSVIYDDDNDADLKDRLMNIVS